MIAGFNTDIEFGGVVYHVQTEDKGLPAKKIITLVYVGGTILASKRTPYDDLANGNFDEKTLTERVQKQHRLICAAVTAGRINELKEMTAKASAARSALALEVVSESAEIPVVDSELLYAAIGADARDAGPRRLYDAVDYPAPIYTTNPSSPENLERVMAELFADAPLVEDVRIVDEETVLPAEAVEVVSELSGRERPSNSKLSVELLGDLKFKGGDRQTVNIMVCRGTGRKVVPGAQIMVKVLGSSFRPVIFHARSDSNGLAKVHMQLPHFQAGRAALLIRALDQGEEIELRRVVTPG